MTGIFVSPSFAQGLVQTHALLEHRHAEGSNTALEQHLIETTFSDDHHHDEHDDDGEEDGEHHVIATHEDKDANGDDLPPHDHDNAHHFIGHVFAHMPALFTTGFSFHFPPLSQITQVDLQTRPAFVIQDAPFRPPRTFTI